VTFCFLGPVYDFSYYLFSYLLYTQTSANVPTIPSCIDIESNQMSMQIKPNRIFFVGWTAQLYARGIHLYRSRGDRKSGRRTVH